ncbi:MAG: cation:proton antiporter [Marinilabiliaceae bacterium]
MPELFENTSFPVLFLTGTMVLCAIAFSQLARRMRLPGVVAYMVAGIILGPSVLNFLHNDILADMKFIIHMVLGFVAFKIGLEINIQELRNHGKAIIVTILSESFLAVILVSFFIYLLTGNLALALVFGALAPASAPAGTIAVIDELKAKGPLTRTLYSVVGIDDGLALIIFGLVSPVAIFLLTHTGNDIEINENFINSFIEPFREIGLSLLIGGAIAVLFIWMTRFKGLKEKLMPLTFGVVVPITGMSELVGLSEILTCMIFGVITGNHKNSQRLKELEEEDIGFILPLFYILFFTIAGANLHLSSVPELGWIGLFYIIGRILGKNVGAYAGAGIMGMENKIKKYLGLGILSQAGVAIGLALITKNNLQGIGPEMDTGITMGDHIGNIVFTTITATSVFFELLGPITTKLALRKANEVTAGQDPEV